MAYSDRFTYRVLVDGKRPFRAQGYPYKRQDVTSVRQDYTHAVVSREVNDHEQAKVYCYCSRLDLAEKRAKAALSYAHRHHPERQEANPVEFLVVPLAWRWAADKWSRPYGYQGEAAAPGGLKGYVTTEEEVTNG